MTDSPDRAFLELAMPLRAGLRVHCYRMLGSAHDSDDMVQETLLRAWRAKGTLEDPSRLKPWLYRIATNACLDELRSRPRRVLASDAYPAADPEASLGAAIDEPIWLEPLPDAWLDGCADEEARYTLKESVALAFVAALQVLTPAQRATLLLRDVVGLSAEETAEALSISVPAANSALFRARATVDEKLVGRPAPAGELDAALLARYIRAWEANDMDALVALLHEEVTTTMPPRPTWLFGRAASAVFFKRMTPRWDTPLRIVQTRANGRQALAYYRRDPEGGPYTVHAISVLEAKDGKVVRIDHFMTKEAFAVFELPAELGQN
jgi:RNA polymerase sigma-70 factor (ECF subfamily)